MSDKTKRFATLRFLKNPLKSVLLEALEYVKHFLIKRNLILVGGMSIDCSLRLKNLKLYGDDEIPDYDCYSPMVSDAYLLASELCNKKFPSVDVLSAIHTTTMRVRVDGNVVADITYMPPKLFEKLRTQEFQGLKIIHPFYNMMDQFRSLSCPYENPPNEVITERWNKDIERFNMLIKAYPLDKDPAPKLPQLLHKCIFDDKKINDKNVVIGGWAALAFHLDRLKIKNPFNWSAKSVHLPVDYVTIATDFIDPYIDTKGAKFYTALFSYPRYVKLPKLEIYDFYGERMTVDDTNKKYASIASLMYYFLHVWLMRHDELGLTAVQIIFNLLKGHPLKLDISCLGKENWNTSTLYSIANILNYERVKNWKPQMQTFSDDCEITRTFDPSQSLLFAIDAQEVTSFENIVERKDLVIH